MTTTVTVTVTVSDSYTSDGAMRRYSATVMVDGTRYAGEVSLVRDQGRLVAAGDHRDAWMSERIVDAVDLLRDRPSLQADVIRSLAGGPGVDEFSDMRHDHCGAVLRHYDDGTPVRRLCGGCSSIAGPREGGGFDLVNDQGCGDRV